MKPHYELDEKTTHRVLELVNICEKLELGNVSFKYYKELKDFYMLEEGDHWQLVVVLPFGKRDVYQIVEGVITYDYSGDEELEKEDSEDED
ncbi:MAG: hypothetical protein WC589_11410 [Sphingobacterium sp.]